MKNVFKSVCFLNGESKGKLAPKITFEKFASLSDFNYFAKSKLFIADGGLKFLKNAHFDLDEILWIGDGDSVSKKELSKLIPKEKQKILTVEKNFSDFAAILEEIKSQINTNYNSAYIEIIGGLGKDKSQEISNLFEAVNFIKSINIPACVVFHPSMAITSGSIEINFPPRFEFSVFPSDPTKECKLKILNSKYSGDIILSRPSHGLHNEAQDLPVKIEPLNEPVFVIF